MSLPKCMAAAVVVVVALALLLIGGGDGQRTLAAGNTVDGLVGAGEYSNSVPVDVFVSETADVVSGAVTVHYGWDADNLYVAVEYTSLDVGADGTVDTGDDPVINENVFGPNSYHNGNSTGWPSHKFHQILGSDALEVTLDCVGTPGTDYNWVQDYLDNPDVDVWWSPSGASPGDAGVSAAGPVPDGIQSASSMQWNLVNSSFDLTHGSTNNKDWTSPNFDPAYPTPDATDAGDFEFAMIYEFSLSLSNVDGCTEVQLGFPSVHNSPTKRGFKNEHGQDIEITPFSLEPTITLEPPTDTNTVGDDHTVTATVELLGNPLPDVDVTFDVTDGPNSGDTDTDTTDADGEATFTYTGDGGAGTDTIEACLTFVPTPFPLDNLNHLQVNGDQVSEGTEICAEATKTWVEPTPTPTPTPTSAPSSTPTPTPTPPSGVLAEVQEPAALPDTGGEPPDGGSGVLPWLAAIVGAVAAVSAGGLWLAYQRRRVR